MLSWPLAFLIVALLAALLGFTGIAGTASWMARLVFTLFLALFLASFRFSRKRSCEDARSNDPPEGRQ
jgi:uncharacterized membrane protein YtjA (UPF0391 family)